MNRLAGSRLPSCPPRDLSPPPVAPRVSEALDNSFAAVATSNESGQHEGEGDIVDSSAVENVAAAVGGGGVKFFQWLIQAMMKIPKNRSHCLALRC
jgi:hypothetical protein